MDRAIKISFIIPAYNEEKLLNRCMLSIMKEVYRYRVLPEIIVVDNGSTDHTTQVARQFGAIVVPEPKTGVTYTRDAGYRAVKNADLLAYCDADNEIPHGWLKAALKAMDDDTVMVTGPLVYHEWGPVKRFLSRGFYAIGRFCHKTIGPMCQGGNFIVRKSAMDAIGGYPTDCPFYGEDTQFAKQISKVGKTKIVPEMWVWSSARRMDGQGMIKTTSLYVLNYFSVTLFGKPLTHTYKNFRS